MKPQLLLGLALVLSGYFIPLSAQAYWASIPVDHANINTTAPFLRVVTTQYGVTNDSRIAFSVYVLVKDKQPEELISGLLAVKDKSGKASDQFIAQAQVQARKLPDENVPSAVPKSWAGKCVVFQFEVAAKFLSDSEFSVDVSADPKWGTAGISYTLNLKEFADENKP
jgi:hypothetical protein